MLLKIARCSFIFFTVSVRLISYEDKSCSETAAFNVYTETGLSFTWENGMSLNSSGCDVDGNFSIIVHGFNDKRLWVDQMIQHMLKHRGGCVIFFDYASCIDNKNYLNTLKKWKSASTWLTFKLKEMENQGVSPANILMYGYSLGGRIAIDASIKFGKQKIGAVDVCDMVGIGFDGVDKNDPKDAASNVQCIFTTKYIGSGVRDQCHQNWLMGRCGNSQPAANDIAYLICLALDCKDKENLSSHSYCNKFYLSAFENDFVSNNAHQCPQTKVPENLPSDFKMGFRETRKHFQGVFASPTFKTYPYNVFD